MRRTSHISSPLMIRENPSNIHLIVSDFFVFVIKYTVNISI